MRGEDVRRSAMTRASMRPAGDRFAQRERGIVCCDDAHSRRHAVTHYAVDGEYPRDMRGYGATPPDPQWPGGARIAVQFVLNYEEGSENSVLHGDAASETFLSEIIGAAAFPARHLSMESLYEYGARAGVWRLLRLFEAWRMPLTIFGVAMALARNPAVADACMAAGHEIASHGYRWISYQSVDEAVEREHIARAVETITRLTGSPPAGWYTGRDSPSTRRLVVEHGGFVYDADSYADDLPYWTSVPTSDGVKRHLVVPYTLDTNDMRFATAQGFNSGDQFFAYLRDAFDTLYAEGDTRGLAQPKMLSIGLHARLAGRPGRTAALARFLDHVARHDDVWVARRIDIARHWIATHPYAERRG
jgi:putative urate catabolism protein